MRRNMVLMAALSLGLAGFSVPSFAAPRNSQSNNRSDKVDQNKRGEERIDMTFDELPGKVKETVGGQTHQGDKVVAVWRVRQEGQNYYHVRIQGTDQRARVIRVTENGKFEIDRSGTPEGKLTVKFNDLPGPAKETIIKQSKGHAPETVRQVTEDGKTWYVADVGEKTIRVDGNGKVVKGK